MGVIKNYLSILDFSKIEVNKKHYNNLFKLHNHLQKAKNILMNAEEKAKEISLEIEGLISEVIIKLDSLLSAAMKG